MVNQVKLTGIVLSASPVGEYDKRLVILTGQRGKITAFVKGARRPSSRFAAGSRPFSFGEFTLYQGREAYNLVDIDIKNYFDEIATDVNALYYGFYFLELADYYSYENVNSKEMINLLYKSLKALSNKNIPDKLVRYIYPAGRWASVSITNSRGLLKLMSIESMMPSNHLILCHLILLHLFQHQGLFQ